MASSTEFDVIIVGGGAAGCCVAGRLAELDPKLQVLIIEYGKNNRDDPLVRTPAFYIHHLKPDSTGTRFYVSKPSTHVNGRSNIIASGGQLGGGSSINFMMYTRASASDYDDWNTEGWTFDDLKPFFLKTETYHVQTGDYNHGYGGPLHVSYGSADFTLADDYIEAAKACGFESTVDVNDFKTVNKVSRWPKWIGLNGKRSDAAHGFVHPVIDRQDNLHLLLESTVVRILFEGTKAVGVEYVANKLLNPSADQTPKTVRARKMVILSSGALSSPLILQRSGIGDATKLKSLAIEPISDLPGVGQNYQDHQLTGKVTCKVDGPAEDTISRVLASTAETLIGLPPSDSLARNFVDTGIKLRPTEEEASSMGPEFQKVWNEYFRDKPDKPLIYIGILFPNSTDILNESHITMGQYLEYPFSKGYIHIASKDVYAMPDFDAGFLSHPADLAPQVWGYKKNREIIRRMASFRGEHAPTHPLFPVGSPAACRDKPERDISDIKYTAEDDLAIENWVRELVETSWHSMGTCAMKPRDQGGVVDKFLNVYGTENLKIADLSICPGNVGANTYSTALVIGEKTAAIVAKELEIGQNSWDHKPKI